MGKFTWNADNGDGTYRNPILYTDYSDPDVIRVGEDYYMVASSFCNSPGLPVLHSKDLVNWRMLSYVVDRITEPGYEVPWHGHGVWAPAIRYHDGWFMVYYPMPDEGIFMSKAKDAAGPWSEPVCVRAGKGWIDPCPFWDEDGQAYLVNGFAKSRSGIKSILHISPMNAEGTALTGEGRHVFDGHNTQPTIEGPKMYKRNGYYYILAPAGSVKSGWQVALRSRQIYGPYEEKIVMMQGDARVNGPHQGGWVDTPSGEDWFLHFQDVGNAGRIVHLQPMRWEKDWPIIGQDDGEGYGIPVESWKKPDVGASFEPCSPDDSDDFSGRRLGLQWQWNANYREEWYRMEQPGIRLYAQPFEGALCDAPNLLLQKWTAPAFAVTAKVDVSGLKDGDLAGLVSQGLFYTALAVKKEAGGLYLTQVSGHMGETEKTRRIGAVADGILQLGMQVYADGSGQFLFPDVTGIWRPAGEKFLFTPGKWVGVKYGLFAVHQGAGEAGSLLGTSVLVDADRVLENTEV
ncbi:MAG: glycoside hydrolase 43 family protein [Candidatus Limivivens sp.]|nr:glycoside hydrolase 43 family protein [Candidatus Limivivens sp.]